MKVASKNLVVTLVALAVWAVPSAQAAAKSGLDLSVSSPRVEGGPITFTASGTAAGRYGDGESTDYVQGAVLRAGHQCPVGGASVDGEIRNAFADTFHAFPAGQFTLIYRMRPAGINPQELPAGRWRECVYLQDRASNAVVASGERAFAVRRPHARLALKRPLPRHIKLAFDVNGRPNGTAIFKVRARVELPRRTLQVLVTRPGFHGPCLKLLGDNYSPYDGVRMKSGAARTYRVRTPLLFKAGPMPYGKRVRVCAAIHYQDPRYETDMIEGWTQLPLVLHR